MLFCRQRKATPVASRRYHEFAAFMRCPLWEENQNEVNYNLLEDDFFSALKCSCLK